VHTNPILICFCSILYYRDLGEHIRRYRIEKQIVKAKETNNLDDEVYYLIKKFGGKLVINDSFLKEKSSDDRILRKKIYNQLIVNRWHVLLRLSLNKELIPYRQHNIRKKNKSQPISILTRMKLFFVEKKIKK